MVGIEEVLCRQHSLAFHGVDWAPLKTADSCWTLFLMFGPKTMVSKYPPSISTWHLAQKKPLPSFEATLQAHGWRRETSVRTCGPAWFLFWQQPWWNECDGHFVLSNQENYQHRVFHIIITQNWEVRFLLSIIINYFLAHPTFEAYPFQVSPEDAQKYLSIFGSTTCNIQKLLPSFGAHYLPFLNFDFVRPVRFSAVYFPAWFVNGEVEANITYKGAQVRSIFCFIFLGLSWYCYRARRLSGLRIRAWTISCCVLLSSSSLGIFP